MDPDEALRRLRSILLELEEGLDEELGEATYRDVEDDVSTLIDVFSGLDNWLKKGGFLPKDWARVRDNHLQTSVAHCTQEERGTNEDQQGGSSGGARDDRGSAAQREHQRMLGGVQERRDESEPVAHEQDPGAARQGAEGEGPGGSLTNTPQLNTGPAVRRAFCFVCNDPIAGPKGYDMTLMYDIQLSISQMACPLCQFWARLIAPGGWVTRAEHDSGPARSYRWRRGWSVSAVRRFEMDETKRRRRRGYVLNTVNVEAAFRAQTDWVVP
jgi:hypothetical protein